MRRVDIVCNTWRVRITNVKPRITRDNLWKTVWKGIASVLGTENRNDVYKCLSLIYVMNLKIIINFIDTYRGAWTEVARRRSSWPWTNLNHRSPHSLIHLHRHKDLFPYLTYICVIWQIPTLLSFKKGMFLHLSIWLTSHIIDRKRIEET